ncbi:MAG: 4'-phosphopantetheinyl transferase superfamily protein [Sedimenticola sp.]
MSDIADWQPSSESPHLQAGDLHIWKLDLSISSAKLRAHLSVDEQQRAAKMISPEERKHFIVSRGQMREILARYAGCSAVEIRFGYGEMGKPELVSSTSGIEFNLSHSGDLGLLAVTRGNPVGIDLEPVTARRNTRRIAERVFDQETLEQLRRLDEDEFVTAFCTRWTQLEAKVKALGQGVFKRTERAMGLEAHTFRPHETWIAAVAAEQPLPEMERWKLFRLDDHLS